MPITSSYEDWIKEIDTKADDVNADKQSLYELTKEGYEQFEGAKNVEILWRLARASYKVAAAAEMAKDKANHKKFLLECEEWCKKALELDPENADAHSWYAFMCGKISDHVGTKERIQRGKEVQNHLDAAIKGKPTDPGLYYTYGRWAMEVAKLSWSERKIAALLFSAPPEATYDDAITKFKQADEYKPNWRANCFFIGQSYINLKNYKDGIEWLDKAAKCEVTDEEDQIVSKDMEALQKKYMTYRT